MVLLVLRNQFSSKAAKTRGNCVELNLLYALYTPEGGLLGSQSLKLCKPTTDLSHAKSSGFDSRAPSHTKLTSRDSHESKFQLILYSTVEIARGFNDNH
jgi:hypothetical protein